LPLAAADPARITDQLFSLSGYYATLAKIVGQKGTDAHRPGQYDLSAVLLGKTTKNVRDNTVCTHGGLALRQATGSTPRHYSAAAWAVRECADERFTPRTSLKPLLFISPLIRRND